MAITFTEFTDYVLVSESFSELTEVKMLAYSALADMSIPGLYCLPEECRVQAGALAVAHLAELMGESCGVPLTGITSIQNDQDKVTFSKRSDSELESTRWGFQLRQVMRACTACSPLYFGDSVFRNTSYAFAPAYG